MQTIFTLMYGAFRLAALSVHLKSFMYLKFIYDVLRYNNDEIVHTMQEAKHGVFYLEISKLEKRLIFLYSFSTDSSVQSVSKENRIMRLNFLFYRFHLAQR